MSDKKLTVGIYTLGCKVNQYESEAIAEALTSHGFHMLQPHQVCDIYIINTCTVTAESDRKAGQFIRRAIAKNSNAYIIVTGCLSQTAPEEISKIKGVDFICGNTSKMSAVDAALRFARDMKKSDEPEISVEAINECPFEPMRITRFDRTRAYVKIEDGCENRCTYCIIPKARGKVRSKAPNEVIDEIKALVAGGCKEVVLTGIETASYGKDRKDTDLASLLVEADKIKGLERIRLGSLDPSLITERFVSKISTLRSLTPHFHLSLQSGSDRILALMKRKYNSRMALEGIERLRKAIPGVMFTTDVIVGFPGETEEDFQNTEDFLKKARFLSAHVFAYSKRKGTLAAEMPDQIPKQIKSERSSRLISLQRDIRNSILLGEMGNEYDVLFETQSKNIYTGHTPSFIEISVCSDRSLQGEIHRVRIVGISDGIADGVII